MGSLWSWDASGEDFGSGVEIKEILHFRYGQWVADICEQSSNYRELRNLVESVENLYFEGKLRDCELFLLTDNLVTYYAYYKETSTSRLLNELVLRLRKLQMKGDLILHVIHVAGTRMIESGIDGLSRGDTSAGVMQGKQMISFVPISQSALERSKNLRCWIHSWVPKSMYLHDLSTNEWHSKVFEKGNFLWTPAPAAADAAIEQLCRNFHLHENNSHVVCLPRMMTSRWRKQLLKVADLFVEVPFNDIVWPQCNHEPLILAVILP